MTRTRFLLGLLAACLLPLPLHAEPAELPPLLTQLHDGGYIVLMRHASAPGADMVDDIDLDDCSRQRELSDRGRDEAQRLGLLFREHGLGETAVHTSRYCRCWQTAEALGLGPVTRQPALDSFFYAREQREQRLADMRELIADLADGPSVILVTHRLNILGLTGTAINPADMLIIRPRGAEQPEIVGRISAAVGTRAYRPSSP